jgi:hypothetical protein
MSDYDKETEAFLIKIGQVAPASKPAASKKEEE